MRTLVSICQNVASLPHAPAFAYLGPVARMERSDIRDRVVCVARSSPHFASLNAGYKLLPWVNRASPTRYGEIREEPTARPLRREELHEIVEDLVRRLLLQVVAGRQRLRIDKVLRELAPHRRK